MKKIGIALVTLLAVATSACAESPTATAAATEAALSENPGLLGSGHGVVAIDPEEVVTMMTAQANPGFLGTGH